MGLHRHAAAMVPTPHAIMMRGLEALRQPAEALKANEV
jgi:hypothetical protein